MSDSRHGRSPSRESDNLTSVPHVVVCNSQKALKLNPLWVKRLALRALAMRKEKMRLSIALVDDREIRRVHRDFLNDSSATDVISFDFRDVGMEDSEFDAELVISAECAVKEARKRKVDALHELALYVVHGILHLGGYRDESAAESKRMRAAERALLRKLGLPHVF